MLLKISGSHNISSPFHKVSHVMDPTTLRIAILDCDTPVPNVYAERGLYSDIFISLLEDAAEKTPGLPQLNFQFTKYDAVQGNLPSEEDLRRIDAIIITGSCKSHISPYYFSETPSTNTSQLPQLMT